jgi:exodeoxyribonuclease VII small subunit
MTRSSHLPSSKAETGSDIAEMKFEKAQAELEALVASMEEGSLPLDESIKAYRRGSELLLHCQALLSDAERKIQILENGELRDFDPASGRGDAP